MATYWAAETDLFVQIPSDCSEIYFPALFAFIERQEQAGKLVREGCQIYSFTREKK